MARYTEFPNAGGKWGTVSWLRSGDKVHVTFHNGTTQEGKIMYVYDELDKRYGYWIDRGEIFFSNEIKHIKWF